MQSLRRSDQGPRVWLGWRHEACRGSERSEDYRPLSMRKTIVGRSAPGRQNREVPRLQRANQSAQIGAVFLAVYVRSSTPSTPCACFDSLTQHSHISLDARGISTSRPVLTYQMSLQTVAQSIGLGGCPPGEELLAAFGQRATLGGDQVFECTLQRLAFGFFQPRDQARLGCGVIVDRA